MKVYADSWIVVPDHQYKYIAVSFQRLSSKSCENFPKIYIAFVNFLKKKSQSRKFTTVTI